jgi:hypothetical protein
MNENQAVISKAHATAQAQVQRQMAPFAGSDIAQALTTLYSATEYTDVNGNVRTRVGSHDITADLEAFERGPIARANARAAYLRSYLRDKPRTAALPADGELMKSAAISKADLDVGTLTNLAQVTGGQTLGFISLDTNIARNTIRPGSFTLYQMLKKTRANQVVDYWPSATEIGGALPGAAFNAFNSVTSGALATSAGQYNLNNITLKLALDGRAITMALAAQNNFVDVAGQETTNAALVVLSSVDWALYWGNPAIWPSQPQGLYQNLLANAPSTNNIDFQVYKTAKSSLGLSDEQLLFNLIFQQVAEIVKYRHFGIPTHALMGVGTAGDLQSLVTQQLQQIVNVERIYGDHGPLVVNGNLQGMNTRFGDIQFPVDLMMTSRDIPAQAIQYQDGTSPATASAPTPPASVTVAVSGAANSGSDWTAAYCASSGIYTYAVASTDALMNESTLTFASAVSGVTLLGAYVLTIAPPAAHDAAAFRVYRSGLGFNSTTGQTTAAYAANFRHIGDVLANGASNVTFADLNTKIPGSETIFILDMDETDDALDYRWLLPLSKIELFAQNLYMPWAVAHIGAPRVRIPRFHGMITNYVPQTSSWDPLKGVI